MSEVEQILRLWHATEAAGEPAVLATVVATRGSSYRLPGARLLITKMGARAGSVSGGCLEDDLLKKAWWWTEAGRTVRRYDTTPDGEIGPGFGLGCNGVIHVSLERLLPGLPNVLNKIEEVRRLRAEQTVLHSITDAATFVETLTPPIRLLIFGAGDDAVPVVRLAALLGWEVCVADSRAHYLRPARFPETENVSLRIPGAAIPTDRWTAALVMSHSYTQDLDVLRTISSNPPRYVGLLGPRKRSLQLLADAGIAEDALETALHSPMGLDIGADGPEQVALSVIAEIQGVLNGREGGPLRRRAGSIHARDNEGAENWVRSIVCA